MAGEKPRSELRQDERLTQRARELGIDLGLIDENLCLSPLERMRQHDENIRQVLAAEELEVIRKRRG